MSNESEKEEKKGKREMKRGQGNRSNAWAQEVKDRMQRRAREAMKGRRSEARRVD